MTLPCWSFIYKQEHKFKNHHNDDQKSRPFLEKGENMAQSKEEKRAVYLQELCGDQYEDLNAEACKNEIARLTKINMDHLENKSAQIKTYNELLKENKDKITYLIERIDYVVHEEQVAAHLENSQG